ncbi:Dihydrolipoyllysine-residue acetyltransferase component of pyruvate dehydrogenase complex [compost metagenome]
MNAPEVAILGVTRAQEKPRRGSDDAIDWRQVLPLSLSYDHRVINGADAARFTAKLAELLAEPSALED